MHRNSRHIISKFKWDTSFDLLERATEFQNNLSSWSNRKIEKEIAGIFDALCPVEQTWRIQSLQLDLGILHFDTLEDDLSQKIPQQLKEKLTRLIEQPSTDGNAIEIFTERASHLKTIAHFLTHGYMPWNYNSKEGSINKIISYQLEHNRQNMAHILRSIGKHQEARKRMAWQINTSNFKKIIEVLEPYNYNEILSFSSQLGRIQRRSTIITGNSSDFEKNLSLWLLHYLLTERGTLFNKIECTTRTLSRLVGHYHLDEKTLYTFLNAAEKVIWKGRLKAKDIASLVKKVEITESTGLKKTTTSSYDKSKLWQQLETLFKDAGLRRRSGNKNIFNELITRLASEDGTQLKALVTRQENSDQFWPSFIQDAEDATMEVILSVLAPGKTATLIKTIYFLIPLLKKRTHRNTFWKVSLDFILKHQPGPVNTTEFLKYCLFVSERVDTVLKIALSDQLYTQQIPNTIKTPINIPIYQELMALKTVEHSENGYSASQQFGKLLEYLLPLNTTGITAQELRQKHEAYKKWLRWHPEMVFDQLRKYPDKKQIHQLIPWIMDEHDALALIKRSNLPKGTVLLQLFHALKEVGQKNESQKTIKILLAKLLLTGIQLLITHDTSKTVAFNKTLFKELGETFTTSENIVFRTLLQTPLVRQKISLLELPKSFTVRLKSEKVPVQKQSSTSQTMASIIKKKDSIRSGRNYLIKNEGKINRNTLFRLIQTGFRQEAVSVIEKNTEFSMRKLLLVGFEISSGEMQKIIKTLPHSAKPLQLLKSTFSFEHFISSLSSDYCTTRVGDGFRDIKALFYILKQTAGGKGIDTVRALFWEHTLECIKQDHLSNGSLRSLVKNTLSKAGEVHGFHSQSIAKEILRKGIKVPATLGQALANQNEAFLNMETPGVARLPTKELYQYAQKEKVEELCYDILTHNHIPTGFSEYTKHSPDELLLEILEYYPKAFFNVLKHRSFSSAQLGLFCKMVPFDCLTTRLGALRPNLQNELAVVTQCHKVLGYVQLKDVSAEEIQDCLHKKVLQAYKNEHWKILSPHHIWIEIMWDICGKKAASKTSFIAELRRLKSLLPGSLQVSFDHILTSERETLNISENLKQTKLKEPAFLKTSRVSLKEGLAIKNAGLVLLNSYISMLFERLGVLENGAFKNEECQLDSVHYLQYLVSGASHTEEALLPLNKVLTGLDIATPVKEGVSISESQKELIEGLILAASQHWNSIGDTSVNGFRGNWLVRDGILTEEEDRWELLVEKRSYDLLIDQSPFSFSIIRHPWMRKPLHVKWPY